MPLSGNKESRPGRVSLEVSAAQLARLKAGDEAAWREFLQNADPVIGCVVHWAKWRFSAQVCEDLKHEVRSALPQALAAFTGNASVHTLVRRICAYKCIDEVRRQVRDRAVFLDAEAPGAETAAHAREPRDSFDPARAILQLELRKMVAQVVTALGEKCAEILRLCYQEGLAYREIARRLGISINTVGPRLAGCYRQFKRKVENNPRLKDYFLRDHD